MLTGMELNFEGLEYKNEKEAHFFIFFAENSKTLVTV